MKKFQFLVLILSIVVLYSSCKKDETQEPQLIFKFKFDPNQERLDNFGQPSVIPAGNAGQDPDFNVMSINYLELSKDDTIPAYFGDVLYTAEKTTQGGTEAVNFDKMPKVAEGETVLSLPISSLNAGTYEYLRVGLAYQNYTIDLRVQDENDPSITYEGKATIASFIGANNYIGSFKIKDSLIVVNANKSQGYWGVESVVETPFGDFGGAETGQAAGTTVVNPISGSSPVPAGACLVTGAFITPFTLTGNETEDVVITISLSTNNSFEWIDTNGNGIFDAGNNSDENIVDMGIRGLVPIVE